MFDRLLRSLGLRQAAPSAAPDRPDVLAALHARLPADRLRFGTLEAYDASGALVSGPWPVVARADPALAAARGNLARDRLRPFGDTPEGEYVIVDRRPGAPGLGTNEVLVLQPQSGDAVAARAAGRAALLLHGGAPHWAATDGSLRVPDDAMLEMLALTSPDPGLRSPRIVVAVHDGPGFDDWRQARAEAGSPARRAWFRAQGDGPDGGPEMGDGWRDGGDLGWADAYDACYATEGGSADAGWLADQAAAMALAEAGFDATPPDSPPPGLPSGAAQPLYDPTFDAAGATFTAGAYDR